MNKSEKQNISDENDRDIFDRLKAGEPIRLDDPEYPKIQEVVNRTIELSVKLNTSTNIDQIRERLSEIIGTKLDESTTIFAPFYTNFGRFIQIGKNVFINYTCSFLDMGGITIEDDVLLGPKVNLITENHPLDPANRRALITQPIVVKRKAWIGAEQPSFRGDYWRKRCSGSRSSHNSGRSGQYNCRWCSSKGY